MDQLAPPTETVPPIIEGEDQVDDDTEGENLPEQDDEETEAEEDNDDNQENENNEDNDEQ
jgi:hypothetical protein